MRFIYLSTKIEGFQTKENAISTFKEYLKGTEKIFDFSEGKIDKNKFEKGEDIFFLHPQIIFGYYTYKIVVYCRAGSDVKEKVSNEDSDFPYYFEIDLDSFRIFVEGIDAKYMQNFINDPTNKISKSPKIVGAIKNNGNGFNGPSSWVYFDKKDSEKIMEWFRNIILDENIQMLCSL